MVTTAAPFISYLVTAYQTEQYVGETIRSVLTQTRSDWELVVVDNGNSDEMAAVVGNFTSDPRIKLIRQENKGVRGGVTAAANAAAGRYVCLLDSDDLLGSSFTERVSELVDGDPGIDAVGCDADLFRDPQDGVPPKGWFSTIGWRSVPGPQRSVSLEEMLDNGIPHYLGAIRRDVWEAHGGYDRCAEDVEPDVHLWLSMAAAGRDIRILPDRLARIRVRSDSESHDAARIASFENRFQKAFMSVCENYPVSEEAVANSRLVRRFRYLQAMRRARWALLDGDVAAARCAAREAFRYRRTVRAALVAGMIELSPRMLRVLHAPKNRVQHAFARAKFRLTEGEIA